MPQHPLDGKTMNSAPLLHPDFHCSSFFCVLIIIYAYFFCLLHVLSRITMQDLRYLTPLSFSIH